MNNNLGKIVPVRNAIMHGRPLTIDEYGTGFAFAQELLKHPNYWPNLSKVYAQYNRDPDALSNRSIRFLDDAPDFGAANNLPMPDYEDTGFLRRPDLETNLKRKILGRYPVITVLGDGGNGKTALTLHTLWNLIESDDHDFDLVLWYSAKTASLTEKGVREINSSYTDSLSIITDAASYHSFSESPFDALVEMLTNNKVLLVIENLETVTGPFIEKLTIDVPGDSKLVFTSRVPVSGDLPISVPEFTDAESIRYLRTLAKAHGLKSFQESSDSSLAKFCRRLGHKPLLLKWLALAVKSGANPERVVSDPKEALRFCLENVLDRLPPASITVAKGLVSVSEGISASVIGELTTLSTTEVEAGLIDLTRFGLVEFSDLNNSERTYRLRPFVKSYIIHIATPSQSEIQTFQKRFQKIQSRFEARRAAQNFNKYDAKNYVVRTKGEAVAESQIRDLYRALHRGEVDKVEAGITNLKISDPGYFEVYRLEGYAAYIWADLQRSIQAYEAALEYGEKQPQLRFFYGGMLLRNGYVEQAALQFSDALRIDPDAAPVLREAARAEMRRSKFDVAKKYLVRADNLSGPSLK